MLIAALLLFVVGCSAFPTSEDGMECLKRCYFLPPGFSQASPDVAGSELSDMTRHSVFKRDVSPPTVDEKALCKSLPKDAKCWLSCPRSRLDAVTHQRIDIFTRICSQNVSTEARKEFVKSMVELVTKLSKPIRGCANGEPRDDDEICKNIAPCVLGVVDKLKDQYPADVVAVVGDEMKSFLALFLRDPKSQNRPDCSALFEPYPLEGEE